jgi:hypothetical protein
MMLLFFPIRQSRKAPQQAAKKYKGQAVRILR